MDNQPTDEALAYTLQNNAAPDTLRALVERHHAALLGFLFRMTGGDLALAEDLTQDAFLRMLDHIDQYAYPRPFKSWLYTIATNLARDYFKSAESRRTVELYDDSASTDPPDNDVLTSEETAYVVAALKRLPIHQRETVILRYYQELSLAEIANALHIPLGTVKSRLSLGLKQLRGELTRELS